MKWRNNNYSLKWLWVWKHWEKYLSSIKVNLTLTYVLLWIYLLLKWFRLFCTTVNPHLLNKCPKRYSKLCLFAVCFLNEKSVSAYSYTHTHLKPYKHTLVHKNWFKTWFTKVFVVPNNNNLGLLRLLRFNRTWKST